MIAGVTLERGADSNRVAETDVSAPNGMRTPTVTTYVSASHRPDVPAWNDAHADRHRIRVAVTATGRKVSPFAMAFDASRR